MKHSIDELVSVALEEPSVIEVIEDFETARRLALRYCNVCGWNRALELLEHSRFSNRLLTSLITESDGQQLQELFDGLVSSDGNLWGRPGPFLVSSATFAFSEVKPKSCSLFSYLLNKHRLFLIGSHPLVNAVDADMHWKFETMHWTVRKNWRRAWEIIKQSANGITFAPMNLHGYAQTGHHRFEISKPLLTDLINQVFERMLKLGLVVEQPEMLEVNPRERSTVFEVSRPKEDALGRNRRPRAYGQDHLRPGWVVAERFAMYPVEHSRTKKISRTGLRALEIARYVSGKRNVKRQRQFERLVRASC